jgi:hypothetical protein
VFTVVTHAVHFLHILKISTAVDCNLVAGIRTELINYVA